MKKKSVCLLALLIALLTLGSCFVFADEPASGAFHLVSTYPADGSSNAVPQNVAVKLRFDRSVCGDATQAANDGIFTIVGGADSAAVEYKACYYPEKYPNEVWLLCSSTLEISGSYTVQIPATMRADDGSVLGSQQSMTFTIRNTKKDNRVYFILMLVMFGAMFALTARDARQQASASQKGNQGPKSSGKVNPYKQSKKTGKSVAEVNQETDAKKKRAAEKAAQIEAEKEEIRKQIRAEREAARKAAQKHSKVKKSGKHSYTSTGRAYPKGYIASLHTPATPKSGKQQQKNQ